MFLADNLKASAISWNSKKIEKVCTSTLEAETKALKYGMNYAIAFAQILKELLEIDVPITCRIDSNQLFTTSHTTKMVADPTLRRDIALIQQNITKGKIAKLEWVKSGDMLADILAKVGVDPSLLTYTLTTGMLPVNDM